MKYEDIEIYETSEILLVESCSTAKQSRGATRTRGEKIGARSKIFVEFGGGYIGLVMGAIVSPKGETCS